MSGIYGIYRYDGAPHDGAPIDPRWLDRMQEAMAYYGPDGGTCRVEGPVGMGHLLLEANPEDTFDRQPLRGERGLVASTARLDNRDALMDALNIPPSAAPQISDGHLVGLAFDRWGEEVCLHLEGDWALAAWDARERRLLLARDAVGNSTLYYFEGKGFIAFASNVKALLALPGIAIEPDRLRLAEVLVAWQHDAELTAFKGIRRLIWAHALSVGPDGRLCARRYWSAEGREPLHYRRDEEYVEGFLERYTRAVQNCLRSPKPMAAELSGGRDSGSVVVIAAPLLALNGRDLTAVTSVPFFATEEAGDRLGNEWDLAHATATMAGANVKHIPVDARDYRVIQGIEHLLDVHDGPSHAACNHYWIQAVSELVSRSGFRNLLTGRMGNVTVSWPGNGSALLALLQCYPAIAYRLLLHAEPNHWLILKRQVLKPLLTPGRRLLRRLQTPFRSPWQSYSALNPEMAKELNLDSRMRAAGHDPTFTYSPLEDLRGLLLSPAYSVGLSMASEMGARHSISILDPTANLSMLEFLLRVPDDQFCRGRQYPWLYTRAFLNRMPETVLYSQRKGLQAADIGHRILRELEEFRECLDALDALPEAQAILNLTLMRSCLDDLVAKVDPDTSARAMDIFLRGLGVGIFLRRLKDAHASGSTSC